MSSDPGQQPKAARSSRDIARRLLPPLVVLVFAGGVYLYARQQRQQQVDDVRLATEQLCREVVQMPSGGAMPPKAQQLQASLTTIQQLQSVLETDRSLQSLVVTVQSGDAPPPYGDGSATHQAFVQITGSPRMVLRYVHPGEAQRMHLIGYWTP